MRRSDSVCATTDGWLIRVPSTAFAAGSAKRFVCTAAIAEGQYGHFSAGVPNASVLCLREVRSDTLIMQWCLPSLQQQAGRRASFVLTMANNGETTGRPNATSNKMESSLRNDCIEPSKLRMPQGCLFIAALGGRSAARRLAHAREVSKSDKCLSLSLLTLTGEALAEAVAGRWRAIVILRREGERSLTLVDIMLRGRSAPPIDVGPRYCHAT
jgi:hypothetical protein